LRGNCFRMSRTEEMAYSPVSSVRTITKLVVLPAPDTAKKNCTQDLIVNTSCCSVQKYDSVYCSGAFLCCFDTHQGYKNAAWPFVGGSQINSHASQQVALWFLPEPSVLCSRLRQCSPSVYFSGNLLTRWR